MSFEPITEEQMRRQREIAARKRNQAAISRGSAALGLTGLGVTGASLIAGKRFPGAKKLHGAAKVAHRQQGAARRKMLKNVGIYTTVGSTGVGSASSLYFAGTQKKESALDTKVTNTQKKMSNQGAVRKSMQIEFAKRRESVAVPKGTRAWAAAKGPGDEWQAHVSEGAMRGYAANARGRQRYSQGSGMLVGGAGLGVLGGVGLSTGRAAIPGAASLLVGTALGVGGFLRRESGKPAMLRSTKIKARGYQRKFDAEGNVNKAWRMPTLRRTMTGKYVIPNPSFVRPRMRRVV